MNACKTTVCPKVQHHIFVCLTFSMTHEHLISQIESLSQAHFDKIYLKIYYEAFFSCEITGCKQLRQNLYAKPTSKFWKFSVFKPKFLICYWCSMRGDMTLVGSFLLHLKTCKFLFLLFTHKRLFAFLAYLFQIVFIAHFSYRL